MLINLTSLIVYAFILVIGADTGRLTARIENPSLRRWTRAFCISVLCMSSVFMAAQAAHVAAGHHFDPNNPLDVTWLLFDWINAIAYLAYLSALRVFVLWQHPAKPCSDAPAGCPRRIKPQPEQETPCQNSSARFFPPARAAFSPTSLNIAKSTAKP